MCHVVIESINKTLTNLFLPSAMVVALLYKVSLSSKVHVIQL